MYVVISQDMDDIKRKLALIDSQLAGRADFHKKIISTTPLLFAAVGLITGILIQSILDYSIWLWLIPLAGSAAAAIVLFAVRKESPPQVFAYAACACFVCLGAIRLATFTHAKPNDVRNFVTDERKLATMRGLVVTKPYVSQNRQWEFARFTYTDPTSSFYLKINQVQTVTGWAAVTGTVRVQVDEPVLDLKEGDCIQAYCWLDRFGGSTNPGQFNTAKHLARRNIFVAASVKSRDSVELLESGSDSIFTRARIWLREAAAQSLVGGLSLEDSSRALLEALLLGYRADIGSDTYEAFRKTGLLHFISLSGMHLGILAGIIWWACKTASLMKPARAAVCIITVGLFLLIVPPRAPTVRAAIISWVFCASFFFRRRSNPLNTLSLAAIILLLIRPTHLFEAGWQLSFACVLGILLFSDRIYSFIYEKIANLRLYKERPKTKSFPGVLARSGSYVLQLFSVGLAAWLGGAGILLYHFYTITPLSFVWTVAAFPLVAGILTTGFTKIILAFLLPTAAALFGAIVTGLADLLIRVVKVIAHFDFSPVLIGHVPLVPIILYYCFIMFVAFAHFRRPLMKKAICIGMVLPVFVMLSATKWQRTHRNNLVMTCLDVGHGQAILVQLPGKANILFDAGSANKADVGRRIASPFLDYCGIDGIDAIVISHNDIDHINGIPEIVRHCKASTVYANDAFFSSTDQRTTAKLLRKTLLARGCKLRRLAEDLDTGSRATIRMLWPGQRVAQDKAITDNDKSLVCLVEFADRQILLCSDIERFAQQELVRLYPDLKAKVVLAPHHGSAKTLEPAFVKNLEPDVLIYSCSRTDYERRQNLNLENRGNSFYTAKDGTITVRIDTDGRIRIDSFLTSQ